VSALVRDALARGGDDIRTIQELLGHSDVSTTMVYAHVLNRGGFGVQSLLDRLAVGGEPSWKPVGESTHACVTVAGFLNRAKRRGRGA